MQFEKSTLEFEIQSLDDVKVLLTRWHRVLARRRQGGVRSPWLTEEHLVNVALEDRQRLQEVVLQFQAPPDLLDQLMAELRDEGYDCPVIKAVSGLWTRCRLYASQH